MPIVARAVPCRPRVRAALIAVGLLVASACGPGLTVGPNTASPPGPSAAPSAAAPGSACAPVATAASKDWNERVWYEVFVRSFADSDGNGIGDLAGLTARLDYLNDGDPATTTDLGVGGIWLMPIAASPSYHGYDVTDYTTIEPDYGDAAAFKGLIAAAHARGVKVVIDFEANHTSNQHPWFVDALVGGSHHDWYVWSGADPGWPNPIGAGNPWHPSSAGYYYGLFSDAMPDLNLRNGVATAELQRVAGFWLDSMAVDGFRIDAARHLIEDGADAQLNTPETHAWLAGFRTAVHATHPDALVLGEVNDAELTSGGYATDGSLDMTFDFEVGPAIANAIGHADAGSLLYSLRGLGKAYPVGGAGTFLSNHDQPRIMTQLGSDAAAAAQAAAVLLTAPGVPFVYYGEELGMGGNKPDEQIRTPFPWTTAEPGHGFTTGTPWEPFADGSDVANVASETADPASLLSAYRDLIRLRAAHPALRSGALVAVESSDPHVAAMIRASGTERLLIIHNLAADPAVNVALTLRSGPLCGPGAAAMLYPAAPGTIEPRAPTVTSGGGFEAYVPLASIPARSTIVIELSP